MRNLTMDIRWLFDYLKMTINAVETVAALDSARE